MKSTPPVLVCLLCLLLTGCASSGSAVATQSSAHATVQPEQVRIYAEPPKKYVIVGFVEASANDFSTGAKTERALRELRRQAAKIGANGVIIDGAGKDASSPDGTGIFYGGRKVYKAFSGKAIVVQEE